MRMTCWTHVHKFAPVRATTKDYSKIHVVQFCCIHKSDAYAAHGFFAF